MTEVTESGKIEPFQIGNFGSLTNLIMSISRRLDELEPCLYYVKPAWPTSRYITYTLQ